MSKKPVIIFLLVITILLFAAWLLRPRRAPAPAPLPSPTAAPVEPAATPARPTASATLPATQEPGRLPSPTPPASTPEPEARAFYVAPDGSPDGDGSTENPWDLVTALKGPDSVRAGDTIWVRGGAYEIGHEEYLDSLLEGEPGKPVTVRAMPGERATIDAFITVKGGWVTFWGLEMIDSNPDRLDPERLFSFTVWGPGTKLINNVIHDSFGVGFWWQAEEAEMYGNLIYSVGYLGSDRGHGHGLYTTNRTGYKQILDNIFFSNFSGINVHAYSEKTYLDGFHFEGNVSFNGIFLVGGLVPASNVELVNNYFYRSPVRLGYRMGVTNRNLSLSGNSFHSNTDPSLRIDFWEGVQASANVAWQGSRLGAVSPLLQEGTDYIHSTPAGVQVITRPNRYEAGRGHIIIYNWDHLDAVEVDISAFGLEPGDRYLLRNAQNYFAETREGVYDGQPVTIPMTGWTIAIPLGWDQPLKPSVFPEFGVFVIEKIVEP